MWSVYSDQNYTVAYMASDDSWVPVDSTIKGLAICELDDSMNQVLYEGTISTYVLFIQL